MKFCDKLQKIRKENNVTQEQLADKLNVSRQAVSKWESGTAYPDTEKLIQISKIFNVSLDELVSGKETTQEGSKKKLDFMEMINKVLEFISKSISMFFAMKFKDKIKFLFEMILFVTLMVLFAWLCNSIIMGIIHRIFMFLPGRVTTVLCNITEALLHAVWIILIVMIFVKIFKSRYLDYYVVITDDSVDKTVIEEPIKELKEKKDYKVVIRDPKDSSFSIFNKIGRVIIFFLKCLCAIIAIPIIFSFIALVIALVFSLSYLFAGIFFNGITLAIIGVLALLYLILEFIYNLIFNRKHAYKRIFIIFIISLMFIGGGLGLSFIGISDMTINEEAVMQTKTYNVEMSDNLIIEEIYDIDKDRIVIDNKMSDIKIDVATYGNIETKLYEHKIHICTGTKERKCDEYRHVDFGYNENGLKIFKHILDDIKHKKISNYYEDYEIDKIYLSENNLTKLKKNIEKYYDIDDVDIDE